MGGSTDGALDDHYNNNFWQSQNYHRDDATNFPFNNDLSSSDFETSHQAINEGARSGATLHYASPVPLTITSDMHLYGGQTDTSFQDFYTHDFIAPIQEQEPGGYDLTGATRTPSRLNPRSQAWEPHSSEETS